jgi:transcriptional regulator with XRE-family HTH domain
VPTVRDSDALLHAVVLILDRERLEQRLTQRALGDLAGITQSAMSKYLRAELHLSVSQFVAMAWALGLRPSAVMAEAESNIGYT